MKKFLTLLLIYLLTINGLTFASSGDEGEQAYTTETNTPTTWTFDQNGDVTIKRKGERETGDEGRGDHKPDDMQNMGKLSNLILKSVGSKSDSLVEPIRPNDRSVVDLGGIQKRDSGNVHFYDERTKVTPKPKPTRGDGDYLITSEANGHIGKDSDDKRLKDDYIVHFKRGRVLDLQNSVTQNGEKLSKKTDELVGKFNSFSKKFETNIKGEAKKFNTKGRKIWNKLVGSTLPKVKSNGLFSSENTPGYKRLRDAINYSKFAREEIKKKDKQKERSAMLDMADVNIVQADLSFSDGDVESGDGYLTVARHLTDVALDFIPFVSATKDIVAIVSGKNYVTGETLANWERALLLGTLLVPSVLSGPAKALAKVARRVKFLAKAGHLFKGSLIRMHSLFTSIGKKGIAQADKIAISGRKLIKVMGNRKYLKVLRTVKGARPDPKTYLSKSYIKSHIKKFEDGASYLVRKKDLDNYGRNLIGRPDDAQFVLTKSSMDDLLKRTGGDISKIEKEIGIPKGNWQGEDLVRIDIAKPKDFDLRIPSGNEEGANSLWLPGGKTISGLYEAVLKRIPKGHYIERGLK